MKRVRGVYMVRGKGGWVVEKGRVEKVVLMRRKAGRG